jgi:hypothetical protein
MKSRFGLAKVIDVHDAQQARGVGRGDTAHRFLLSPGPRRSRAALECNARPSLARSSAQQETRQYHWPCAASRFLSHLGPILGSWRPFLLHLRSHSLSCSLAAVVQIRVACLSRIFTQPPLANVY